MTGEASLSLAHTYKRKERNGVGKIAGRSLSFLWSTPRLTLERAEAQEGTVSLKV